MLLSLGQQTDSGTKKYSAKAPSVSTPNIFMFLPT